ncbi:ImmA/IrrE family metallo-endopeptidase [Phytohabitans maris]|uniref:ImmA/IrrE family metallo-endopeptidase n=1 Tax=Phytohabitans maris TaxID=3071409 RepID=UPI003D18651E
MVDWPYNCDGLTVGLTSGSRPQIFIKSSSNKPRERFTVGHELGHVLLPWHIEELHVIPS